MKIVVDTQELTGAIAEIDNLKAAKKQRDRIHDFFLDRGFSCPGTTDQVVIGEIKDADALVEKLSGQIHQLLEFLSKRGWDLGHGGTAVDIAIGVIKQLDAKCDCATGPCKCEDAPNDYGQELDRQHASGARGGDPLCADCSEGCYNCAIHGGAV